VSTTRVVLADDDARLRAGLSMVLATAPDLEVVGEAADGLSAVATAVRLVPDVVLMDIRMPGIDGIEATRRLRARAPQVAVLVLTTFHDEAYVEQALAAGAAGFALKRSAPERLLDAVRSAAAGDAPLDPAVTRGVIARSQARTGEGDPTLVAALTAREREVLALVGDGMSNHEIGQLLHLAESTVKTHVKRILPKLGARDRAQAVALAHRSGLV
jgi:DNA-binding NarL/FixJ family response regulator